MREANSVSVPKWPFFVGDVMLLGTAYFIYSQSPPPIGHFELISFCVCVAFGAVLGVFPFVLEHRGIVKQLDNAVLGNATEKLQHLEQLAGQISAATNQWQNVQLQAEKTSVATQEITERMSTEARAFTEFLQKANDSEKATLRLEVDKLRRAEADWLQVLVRVLDHVHALHKGAVQSDQPRLIEQMQQFQNACHDKARRVGLMPFGAKAGEPFDAQRHQTVNGEKPAADASVTETLAAGFTFQGRLVRPALVRLGGSPAAAELSETDSVEASAPSQLTLEQPAAG